MKALSAMPLNTTPNFTSADDFYEALIDAHRDLTPPQGHALNARLVLLLANHVGDNAVLVEALAAARADVDASIPAESRTEPD